MALELQVESLEGLDESVAGLYVADGDKFKLDVSGIPEPEDVGGLKSALEKERTARKEADKQAKQLRDQQEELERKKLEEKEDWKALHDKLKTDNEALSSQLINGKRDSYVDRIVSKLTEDDKKAKLLRAEMSNNIQVVDGSTVIDGLPGVENQEQLMEYYKENFPFLVDGNKAAGGGAPGNKGGGGSGDFKTQEQVNAMNAQEKMDFFKGGGRVKG